MNQLFYFALFPGRNVTIPGEVIVLNSIVLPHKDLSQSYKNENHLVTASKIGIIHTKSIGTN